MKLDFQKHLVRDLQDTYMEKTEHESTVEQGNTFEQKYSDNLNSKPLVIQTLYHRILNDVSKVYCFFVLFFYNFFMQ